MRRTSKPKVVGSNPDLGGYLLCGTKKAHHLSFMQNGGLILVDTESVLVMIPRSNCRHTNHTRMLFNARWTNDTHLILFFPSGLSHYCKWNGTKKHSLHALEFCFAWTNNCSFKFIMRLTWILRTIRKLTKSISTPSFLF